MTPRQETHAVLVVDDEESVRVVLGMLVKRAGGEPILVDSSAAARERAAAGGVALAIVDKNLPDGSGVDLLRWLRKESPDTQVMMVTGYANLDSAVEALRLGAFDYIVKPFDTAWVVRRVELALEQRRLRAALTQADQALAHVVERLEPHAPGHARRVAARAAALARVAGGSDDWVAEIARAALLHDIGNLAVPAPLLLKPALLDPGELAPVRAHAVAGGEILAGLAREVALSHHERWDGSGYPAGLRGEEIPLSGRIVGLADAWEAMIAERPWRPALLRAEAIAQLRAGGFDPTLVDTFLAHF